MALGGQILILSQFFRVIVVFPYDRMALAPEIPILSDLPDQEESDSMAAGIDIDELVRIFMDHQNGLPGPSMAHCRSRPGL